MTTTLRQFHSRFVSVLVSDTAWFIAWHHWSVQQFHYSCRTRSFCISGYVRYSLIVISRWTVWSAALKAAVVKFKLIPGYQDLVTPFQGFRYFNESYLQIDLSTSNPFGPVLLLLICPPSKSGSNSGRTYVKNLTAPASCMLVLGSPYQSNCSKASESFVILHVDINVRD